MGKRASGAAGGLSQSVAAAVAQARKERGWDNQRLYSAADMSESYYYVRMRGDQPFNLNDLEKLANALGVHWFEICRRAVMLGGLDGGDIAPSLDVDPGELSTRIQRVIAGLRSNGAAYSWGDLLALAELEGVPLSSEQFAALQGGTVSSEVSARVPALLAKFWDVPVEYFTDFDNAEANEMTDALLEFRQAMQDTGALSIAARTLGDITPAALRALTRTLRSIS
ncbi:helix-turn-helix domain-containing protein [Microbacterium sp. NPDC055665]